MGNEERVCFSDKIVLKVHDCLENDLITYYELSREFRPLLSKINNHEFNFGGNIGMYDSNGIIRYLSYDDEIGRFVRLFRERHDRDKWKTIANKIRRFERIMDHNYNTTWKDYETSAISDIEPPNFYYDCYIYLGHW